MSTEKPFGQNHIRTILKKGFDVLIRETLLKLAPVLRQTHILTIMIVFPDPIDSCSLAIMRSLLTDMIPRVITNIIGHGQLILLIRMDTFEMNGCIDLIVRDSIDRFMAAYKYLQFVHCCCWLLGWIHK